MKSPVVVRRKVSFLQGGMQQDVDKKKLGVEEYKCSDIPRSMFSVAIVEESYLTFKLNGKT